MRKAAQGATHTESIPINTDPLEFFSSRSVTILKWVYVLLAQLVQPGYFLAQQYDIEQNVVVSI